MGQADVPEKTDNKQLCNNVILEDSSKVTVFRNVYNQSDI